MAINVSELSEDGRVRVEKVLLRAAEDIQFRDLLLANPDEALKDTDLSPDEAKMVARMKRVALEEWGVDVRQFRSFLLDNGNKIALGTEPA